MLCASSEIWKFYERYVTATVESTIIGTVTVDEESNPRPKLLVTVLPEERQHAVEDVLQSANLLSASDPGTFILDVQFLYGEDVFVAYIDP